MNIKTISFNESLSLSSVYDSAFITANHRQSRFLAEEIVMFGQSEHPNIGQVYSACVLAFDSWVKELWLRAQDLGLAGTENYLLETSEHAYLWRNVLSQSDALPNLIDQSDLARQCQAAYEMDSLYGLSDTESSAKKLQDSTLQETEFYLQVKDAFLSACQNANVVTSDQAIRILINQLRQTDLTLIEHRRLYLYGFADLPPLYRDLLISLDIPELFEIDAPNNNERIVRYVAESSDSELIHAARWAKQQIGLLKEKQKNGNTANSDGKIAVIIPDLLSQRPKVERIFSQILEPERYYADVSKVIPSLFDISAGVSISECPVIKDALTLLQLCNVRMSRENALSLIQSPYWATGYDDTRSKIKENINRTPEIHISVAYLIKHSGYFGKVNASDTVESQQADDPNDPCHTKTTHSALISWRMHQPFFRGSHTLNAWIDWYLVALKGVGWPGARAPTSYEYQNISTFFEMLHRMKRSKLMCQRRASFQEFKLALHKQSQQTVFQAQVKHPQVRILGLLEAAGLHFEASLIVGLNATTLPALPKPHPFFPMYIHHEYKTPRSSSEREFYFACKLLDSLVASSRQVYLSYVSQDENGHLLPSPLLNRFSQPTLSMERDLVIHDPLEPYRDLSKRDSDIFEHVVTGRAPRLVDNAKIAGGAYHLNLQWANPLFAFFKFRLGIDQPILDSIGITPIQRGVVLHSVLADIYKPFSDKKDIAHYLAQEDVYDNVYRLIDKTLSDQTNNKRLANIVREDESARLTGVCLDVLKRDMKRPEVFHIAALEKKIHYQCSDWHIELRIDRIDTVDGKPIVFDYKTGQIQLGPLVKKPLKDYQLPLYAIALEQCIGVSYFSASENQVDLLGLGDESETIDHLRPANAIPRSECEGDWSTLIDNWKHDIENRVQEIARGEVTYALRRRAIIMHYAHYLPAVREEERQEYARYANIESGGQR